MDLVAVLRKSQRAACVCGMLGTTKEETDQAVLGLGVCAERPGRVRAEGHWSVTLLLRLLTIQGEDTKVRTELSFCCAVLFQGSRLFGKNAARRLRAKEAAWQNQRPCKLHRRCKGKRNNADSR